MRRLTGLGLALFFAVGASAAAQEQPFRMGDASSHFQLARGLTEVSGLAVASDKSVYAHNDEHGIIYEIALSNGEIIAAFALGEPTTRADFEGIAALEGRIYLVTSTGLLYEAMIGAHRARVRYNIYDTGVGEYCEVEGLTPGPAPAEFLLICKIAHRSALEGRLLAFKWSLADRMPVRAPWLNIPLSEILTFQERKNFRPSAIEWREQDKSLMVLSARSHLVLTLRRDGTVLLKKTLAAEIHRQAEGVAIMPSGDLVIADEGTMRLPGALTIYRSTQ